MRFEYIASLIFACVVHCFLLTGEVMAAEAEAEATSSATVGDADLTVDAPISAESSELEPGPEGETPTEGRISESGASISSQSAGGEGEGDAVVSSPSEGYAAPLPVSVSSGGAFSFSVPIKVLAFRGLEPRISLAYGSSGSPFGSPHNIVGAGWQLTGFSEITRNSVGRGLPFFEDDQDIFMMDGQELLACKASPAPNKWNTVYPADWKTTGPSASCTAGGNFAPLNENYLKIEHIPGANGEWRVTRKNGTMMVYKPLWFFISSGDRPSDSEEKEFTQGARWLLYQVKDRQENANVVTYGYHIEKDVHGWAHVPKSIEYGKSKKYKITLHYKMPNGAYVTYATGISRMGGQGRRLKSIEVKAGVDKVRAYRLDHVQSDVLKRYQLSRGLQCLISSKSVCQRV